MHHLLTAFFALIFSVGHAQPIRPGVNLTPAPIAIQNPGLAPSRRPAFSGCSAEYDCPIPAAPHIRTPSPVRPAFQAPRR